MRKVLFTFSLFFFWQGLGQSASSDYMNGDLEEIIQDLMHENKISADEISLVLEADDEIKRAYGSLLMAVHLNSIDTSRSSEFLETAERTAHAHSDSILLVNVFIQKGRIEFQRNGDSGSSVFNLQKALEISQSISYPRGIIQSYKDLSFQAMRSGEFIIAIDYLLTAKPYIDELNNDFERAALFNNIGHIYMHLDLPSEAIKLFEEDYKISLKLNLLDDLIISKLNQAEAFIKLGNSDEALNALSTADSLFRLSEESDLILFYRGFYFRNHGLANLLKEDFEKALSSFKNSMTIDPENQANKVSCHVGKHQALLGIGDTINAHKELLIAASIEEDNSKITSVVKVNLYKHLANSYDLINDSKNSVKYHKAYSLLNDKISDRRIISDYLLKEVNQRLERAQLEQKLESEKVRSERQQKYILGLITIIVLAVGSFIVYRNLQSRRHSKTIAAKNRQLQSQNVELEKKSNILELANQKATSLNKDLEKQVKNSNLAIKDKNQIIDTYSFINSHKLRSPVASIKGISQLFFSVSDEEQKMLMEYLAKEIERLDDIVKEIQESLSDT